MDTLAFFNMALTLVAALFSILTVVLGWMGNKLYDKLDTLAESLHKIETDVHNRITKLEVRIAKLETMTD